MPYFRCRCRVDLSLSLPLSSDYEHLIKSCHLQTPSSAMLPNRRKEKKIGTEPEEEKKNYIILYILFKDLHSQCNR